MIECQVCKHQFEDDTLLSCPDCGNVLGQTGSEPTVEEKAEPAIEEKAEGVVLEVQDITHKSGVEEPDNG